MERASRERNNLAERVGRNELERGVGKEEGEEELSELVMASALSEDDAIVSYSIATCAAVVLIKQKETVFDLHYCTIISRVNYIPSLVV